VSSPNEPGYPGAGDPANGNGPKPSPTRSGGPGPLSTAGSGSLPSPGPVADPGDKPPWQRGPATRARQQQREKRPPNSGSIDSRTTRFPAASVTPPSTVDPDGIAREAYPSELPDLSGPLPRSAGPRKAPVERAERDRPVPGPPPRSSTGHIQVATRSRGPVRASMQIRRIDPWSVLKVSLVLSVALFFVWMIAVAFLYLVLGGMGVWSKLNSNVGDLLTNTSNGGQLVSSGAIFGGAALIGLVNIVLLTAMATVAAFIYNLTTDMVGGIEVTLADRD
jgi:Transmembrane domain of unknown function (DUF3566)